MARLLEIVASMSILVTIVLSADSLSEIVDSLHAADRNQQGKAIHLRHEILVVPIEKAGSETQALYEETQPVYVETHGELSETSGVIFLSPDRRPNTPNQPTIDLSQYRFQSLTGRGGSSSPSRSSGLPSNVGSAGRAPLRAPRPEIYRVPASPELGRLAKKEPRKHHREVKQGRRGRARSAATPNHESSYLRSNGTLPTSLDTLCDIRSMKPWIKQFPTLTLKYNLPQNADANLLQNAQLHVTFRGVPEDVMAKDKVVLMFYLNKRKSGAKHLELFHYHHMFSSEDQNVTVDVTKQVERWLRYPQRNKGLSFEIKLSNGVPLDPMRFVHFPHWCETVAQERSSLKQLREIYKSVLVSAREQEVKLGVRDQYVETTPLMTTPGPDNVPVMLSLSYRDDTAR